MDFKKMLEQLGQLSEATEVTAKGVKHTAEPGRYGGLDTDDEGDEKKTPAKPAAKRGRGRPRKDADAEGNVPQYKGAKELQGFIVGNLPKGKLPGKPGKKHKLKDWVEHIEAQYIAEAGLTPTQTMVPGFQAGGKTAEPTVIDVKNPALKKALDQAAKDKQITTIGIPQGTTPAPAGATGQTPVGQTQVKEKWGTPTKVNPAEKGKYAGKDKAELLKSYNALKKSGPHKKGTPEFGRMRELAFAIRAKGGWGKVQGEESVEEGYMGFEKVKKAAEKGGAKDPGAVAASIGRKKYGKEKFQKAAAAGKKLGEGERPSQEADFGAGLGAGRSNKQLEEGMEHRLQAARHLGKSHALSKEAYNCKFDDMEEARCYHDGYKEGLDECYGHAPVLGLVDEVASTIPGMATTAMPSLPALLTMEDDMEEGNAFTAALAKTRQGDKFSLGGKSFTDNSGYDADLDETFAFESLDKQLAALLNEGETKVDEGMSVSISKGQQGAPDSVSVTANDADADQLLGLIKSAGLGLFGGDSAGGYGAPASGEEAPAHSHGDISVVDDHDGMMSLIKKVTGQGEENADYADEEGEEAGEEGVEEVCDACGESQCQCGDEEAIEEVETPDQQEFEVSEDNLPDSDAEETTADEESEAEEDEALATSDDEEGEEESDEEETVTEWANEAGKDGTDEQFETDLDFITKAISGGLNKPKATGQTTVPVIAGQNDRMGYTTNESVSDWKKLAGIK